MNRSSKYNILTTVAAIAAMGMDVPLGMGGEDMDLFTTTPRRRRGSKVDLIPDYHPHTPEPKTRTEEEKAEKRKKRRSKRTRKKKRGY